MDVTHVSAVIWFLVVLVSLLLHTLAICGAGAPLSGSGSSSVAPDYGQQQASFGPAASSNATVTFARQLNEAESNLLLTGAADGAVRIWRAYLNQVRLLVSNDGFNI